MVKVNNLRLESCGCRYRTFPNINYLNNEMEECEYLCANHFNKYVLKLYNEEHRRIQLKPEWLCLKE
jgi:Ser/Thr protein kinase RdoA (MazF antagonist)